MLEYPKLYGDGIHDDTAAIQEILDNEFSLNLYKGTYLISETLFVGDNTHIILGSNVTIRLADGANCIMLANRELGSDKKNYNITIEGGIWDGNNVSQIRGKTSSHKRYNGGQIMRFEGIEDLFIRNITFKDPETYAIQILYADRFTVENITFDYNMLRVNMDGVHIQGPARNGYINNIKGATNDDLVALNCDDGYDDFDKGYNEGCVTQGDIENITVENLYADNGYTAVRLLSCGSVLKNVNIRNIYGTYRFYGVSFTHHNIVPNAFSYFDNINIDGVFCSKPPQNPPVDRKFINIIDETYGAGVHDGAVRTAPVIWFANGINCGNISIRNVNRIEEAVTEAPTISIEENVKIERLTISNITQKFFVCDEVPAIKNLGEIGKYMVC